MSKILHGFYIETPLGQMLAVGDDKTLYLLEFADSKGLKRKLGRLERLSRSVINQGMTSSIISIAQELKRYFLGELESFTTPCHLMGTPFQLSVWEKLKMIPFGKTKSYAELATMVGKEPTACRAVAQANGANTFAILIPCHRIIRTGGALGGYAAGVKRKEWLIHHEADAQALSMSGKGKGIRYSVFPS